MLGERNTAEHAWQVSKANAATLKAIHSDVIYSRANDLPEIHPLSCSLVDHFRRRERTPGLHDYTDAIELPCGRLRQIIDTMRILVAQLGREV
jgi:hypothetical protein